MSLPFPNVPVAPGVPPVPRLPGAATQVLSLVPQGLSGTLWQSSQAPDVWGVFDQDGNLVLEPDSITSFNNSNEWNISNFPIQGGKLSTYNKVFLPFEAALTFRVTGTASERNGFLIELDAIADDTNLYTIITPEWTYQNVNITRYTNPRQNSERAYSIEVDVFFLNVPAVTAQYSTTQTNTSNAQDPTAEPQITQGSVNAQPIDPQTQQTAQPAVGFEDAP